MKKTIIGIVPTTKIGRNDNPYNDIYKFVNAYSSRILESNAIPIGILLKDSKLDQNILDICDGFLFPGGNRVEALHFEILDYAVKNNKPILGICLGMQAMACYSILKEEAKLRNENKDPEDLILLRKKLQKENIYMLEKLETGHIHGEKIMNEEIEINLKNLQESTHSISILPNTKLYKVYKLSNTKVISLHSYRLYTCGYDFKASALADDGTIEAIEHINKDLWIVGVQFHPELDKDNPIWESFIAEVSKRSQKKI